MVNTTQLHYFLELARTRNYTDVSKRFFITQPTLSRNIIALEDEIGAKLFSRESGGVELTAAGKLLLEELEPLSARYEDLLHRVRNRDAGITGELTIGLSAEQQMPDTLLTYIRHFVTANPGVELRLRRLDNDQLHRGLQDGTVDLAVGLGYPGTEENTALKCVVLQEERPCLIRAAKGNADGPLIFSARECRSFLENNELIFPRHNTLRGFDGDPVEMLRKMLRLPELSPKVRYVDNISDVPLYVSAGLGVTIANRSHCITGESGVGVLEILDAEPYRKVMIYPSETKNHVLERFLAQK